VSSTFALRVPCDAYVKLHPHLEATIDVCTYAQGWLLEELGKLDEARSAFSRVRVHASMKPLATGYLQFLDGKWVEARDAMLALADKLDLRSEYWMKNRSADARLIVALSELELGHRDVAIAQLERTLATLEATAPFLGRAAFHHRRRARVEAWLARTVAATDPAAAQYATTAAAWYRTAEGYEAVLGEMEALIKGSP
jgi:hypothetical protein